jgi:ferredoxin
MRIVNLLAQVSEQECNGCGTCVKVCPTLAITLGQRKGNGRTKPLAVIDVTKCVGCWACEQRCPSHALHMVRHPSPHRIGVSTDDVPWSEIAALCRKARLHPEQVICYCTTTRAAEVAAAILKGLETPEEISQFTGSRTGCKVECTQPILRLLEAAGVPFKPTLEHGWQLYGRTVTAWEVPEAVKAKYASRGFYFDEDIKLLDRIVAAGDEQE